MAAPNTPPALQRAGDFERYALVAALTLLVLCLLLADDARESEPAREIPRDRVLRVEIGGSPPAAAPAPIDGSVSLAPPRARPAPPDGPRARPPPAIPAREPRTATVQPAETLSDIAQRELGSARRAPEIAALNGLADPDVVVEGQVLTLPGR